MSARLEARCAADLRPDWICHVVSVPTIGGIVTGVLTDYQQVGDAIGLFIGGRTILAWPSTTVTRGSLDVDGGAA